MDFDDSEQAEHFIFEEEEFKNFKLTLLDE